MNDIQKAALLKYVGPLYRFLHYTYTTRVHTNLIEVGDVYLTIETEGSFNDDEVRSIQALFSGCKVRFVAVDEDSLMAEICLFNSQWGEEDSVRDSDSERETD